MKLTTFKKLEESVIEDKDAVVESSMNDSDKTVDTAAVLEKQDSSPTTDTVKPTASSHTEI